MSQLEVHQLPVLQDNDAYLAHGAAGGATAVVEPGNPDLQARGAEIDGRRAQGNPTVPSTLGEERATNPFPRPGSENQQRSVGLMGGELAALLAATRRRKDGF